MRSYSPKKETIKARGTDPAYFSCYDIHAYYGESYIVQGVSFDIREGEIAGRAHYASWCHERPHR